MKCKHWCYFFDLILFLLVFVNMALMKSQVVRLYKTLLFMGRDYPLGYEYFQVKCHGAFLKNKHETDPEKIAALIKHGEYIVKELEALYMLRKYRTLKRRYYNDNEWSARYQMSLKNIESSVKQ